MAEPDFGVLLGVLRRHHKLTQSALAKRANFDRSYVSRLESGSRLPTREAVGALAAALTLTDPERNRLLAAAGFMPTDAGALLADPALAELQAILSANGLPPYVDHRIRVSLALIADYARQAAKEKAA